MKITPNGNDVFRRYRADKEYIRFLKEANRVLLERPDYVALAPCGSRFKGYAVEESDFDVLLIAGDGTYVTEGSFNTQLKGLAEEYGKSGGCLPFCYDLEYFEISFAVPTLSSNYAYYDAVWPLLYPLRGKYEEIRRLRRLAKFRHAEYLFRWPAFAIWNIRQSVYSALYHEWGVRVNVSPSGVCTLEEPIGDYPFGSSTTIEKCLARGFSRDCLGKTVESRGQFWWQRAVRMLGHVN